MGLVITVSGPHGTGKTTFSKALARDLKLRCVSAGQLFREIATERGLTLTELSKVSARDPSIDRLVDERTKAEASKGCCVLEGQLAGWFAHDKADLNIYLTSPDEIRIRRIAKRERLTIRQAREQTALREAIQRERYRKFYGIEIDDMSIYDLVFETSKHGIRRTQQLLRKSVIERLKTRGKNWHQKS